MAFLLLALAFPVAPVLHATEVPLPTLVVGRATGGVVVDGKLEEAAWRHAACIPTLQDWKTGEVVAPPTQVRVCWDPWKLYVAYVCREPHPDQLVARMKGEVWNDDDVELFVHPPGRFAYYHFMVNSLGRWQSEKSHGGAYGARAHAAAVVGKDRWTVELAVPWSDLNGPPKAGETWRMNFNRVRKPSPGFFGLWSVTRGPFHNPARFGNVRFVFRVPCLVREVSPGRGVLGMNRVHVAGFSTGARNAAATVRLGTATVATKKLPPAGAWEVKTTCAVKLDSAETLTVCVRDQSGVAYEQSFPVVIPGREELLALKGAAAQAERRVAQRRLPAALRQGLLARAASAHALLGRANREIRRAILDNRGVPEKGWDAVLTEARRRAAVLSGPVVWTRNPFFVTTPSSLPKAMPDQVQLQLETVLNEQETGALLISNLFRGKALELRVRLGPLEAVSGTGTTALEPFALGAERLTLAEAAMVRSATRGRLADPVLPLDEAGRLFVPAGETRELWLTVDTFQAKPGLYRGSLRLAPFAPTAHPWTLAVPVSVRVWPVKLRKTVALRVFNFDYGRGGRSEAWLRDLLHHRVNVFALRAPVPNAQGVADFSVLDEPLRRVGPHGLVFFESWFFRSQGWRPRHERWVKDFVAYMKSKGYDYDDWVLHIFDETLSDLFLDTAKAIKRVDPRLRLFSDRMGTPAEVKRFAPYVDYWCPHFAALAKPGLKTMRETGHPIWTYDCGSGKAVAPTHNRALPWCAWRYRLEGVCYWTYFSSYGDTWNDFDFDHPDWSKVYPGRTGEPVSSKRWEAWREGLEDWALFDLYSRTLKTKGATAADRKLLSQIDAIGSAADAPAEVLERVSTQVLHRVLDLEGIHEPPFPPDCTVAWTVRRAGDGRGRVLRLVAESSGGKRQTGAALHSATDRSWTFLLERVDARQGDKVVLRLRAKGKGRLKAGICEGFHWGGDGTGHRTTVRIYPLHPAWTRITLEHVVRAQPVEALIGFDYGNAGSSAEVRDYRIEVVAGK